MATLKRAGTEWEGVSPSARQRATSGLCARSKLHLPLTGRFSATSSSLALSRPDTQCGFMFCFIGKSLNFLLSCEKHWQEEDTCFKESFPSAHLLGSVPSFPRPSWVTLLLNSKYAYGTISDSQGG